MSWRRYGPEAIYLSGASICGLNLFRSLSMRETAAIGLSRLLTLVQQGVLVPKIALVRPWTGMLEIKELLRERKYLGKAILTIE